MFLAHVSWVYNEQEGLLIMQRKIIGGCVLLAGAVLVAVGVHLGQEAGVFRKAIFICLECIGIG